MKFKIFLIIISLNLNLYAFEKDDFLKISDIFIKFFDKYEQNLKEFAKGNFKVGEALFLVVDSLIEENSILYVSYINTLRMFIEKFMKIKRFYVFNKEEIKNGWGKRHIGVLSQVCFLLIKSYAAVICSC